MLYHIGTRFPPPSRPSRGLRGLCSLLKHILKSVSVALPMDNSKEHCTPTNGRLAPDANYFQDGDLAHVCTGCVQRQRVWYTLVTCNGWLVGVMGLMGGASPMLR